MIFRQLNIHDYNQFKILINEFRKTEFSLTEFKEILNNEKYLGIYILEENNNLVGSGTILFEKKFIHNISLYGHIEDIIIKKEYRKKGLGKLLINNLVQVCKDRKCYKILLDCSIELINFYEKCGFKNNGNQMTIYL